MKKLLSTPVLLVLAIAVWLAASLLATWAYYAYDAAFDLNTTYFWVWGAVTLLFGLLSDQYADEKRPARTPRWVCTLLLLACTLLAYIVLQLDRLSSLLYTPGVWWFCLLILICVAVCLYPRLYFRRPLQPHRRRTSLQNASIVMLTFFAPFLVVLPIYLAVMHPVSVKQITPIGEAEGGRFIGRITGDRSKTPLGVYFFVNDDNEQEYYYDVLTGKPVDYG